jgi:putative N6-adenine-specific DNA methylase
MKFFVVCPPGLEKSLEQELTEFWPDLLGKSGLNNAEALEILSIEKGGLELECSPLLGYQINFFSKIASRVLQRVTTFKVKEFPVLHGKLNHINFASFFGEEKFILEVEASKSLLNNEKRIFETAQRAWPQAHGKMSQDPADAQRHRAYLRMYLDQLTLSIDTTGRHLHFRNPLDEPKKIGAAPLRENLAAFMVRNLTGDATLPSLQEVSLWDPMAGSGTLPLEALRLHRPNFEREFAFQKFHELPKILRTKDFAGNFRTPPQLFGNILASDCDPESVERMKYNLRHESSCEVFQLNWGDKIPQLPQVTERKFWILCNPPYDQRLSTSLSAKALGESLGNSGADKISFLMPPSLGLETSRYLAPHYNLEAQIEFENGGLRVSQFIFAKV